MWVVLKLECKINNKNDIIASINGKNIFLFSKLLISCLQP